MDKHLYRKSHNYSDGDAKATEQHEHEMMEKIVHKKSNDEEDEFTQKLETAVKQIDDYIRPYMKL